MTHKKLCSIQHGLDFEIFPGSKKRKLLKLSTALSLQIQNDKPTGVSQFELSKKNNNNDNNNEIIYIAHILNSVPFTLDKSHTIKKIYMYNG